VTSKDKTGDQLVASIRKSKTGAVARKSAATSAASKPQSPARGSPRVTAAKPAKQEIRSGSDPYSIGRRVWPD